MKAPVWIEMNKGGHTGFISKIQVAVNSSVLIGRRVVASPLGYQDSMMDRFVLRKKRRKRLFGYFNLLVEVSSGERTSALI